MCLHVENWCENERRDGKICSDGGRYDYENIQYYQLINNCRFCDIFDT